MKYGQLTSRKGLHGCLSMRTFRIPGCEDLSLCMDALARIFKVSYRAEARVRIEAYDQEQPGVVGRWVRIKKRSDWCYSRPWVIASQNGQELRSVGAGPLGALGIEPEDDVWIWITARTI